MRYRTLGRTGLQVSEVALGGWLTIGGSVEEENAIKIIHKAFDKGVNLFDTAEAYYFGESERVMGKALSQLPRDEYVIATKVSGQWNEFLTNKFGPLKPNQSGHSRKHIVEAVEQSLMNLQVDHIDLYQLHWFDQLVPPEETMAALDSLVHSGKVLYAGCSNYTSDQIRNAHLVVERNSLSTRFVSLQPRYNMLSKDFEGSLQECCQAEGMGAIVYSPLAQGALTGKYKPGKPVPKGSRAEERPELKDTLFSESNLKRVVKLEKIARRRNKSLSQLAIAWILRLPEVSSAIVGATSIKHIEDNVKGSGWSLSKKDLEEIEKILEG